jgi:hypothetical protein
MLERNEQCQTFEFASIGSISCVWVETESPKCKSKQESCDDIFDSKEWCETEGSVFGETLCIWVEENINNDGSAKCINQVFTSLLNIYIYSFSLYYICIFVLLVIFKYFLK